MNPTVPIQTKLQKMMIIKTLFVLTKQKDGAVAAKSISSLFPDWCFKGPPLGLTVTFTVKQYFGFDFILTV